MRRSERSAKRGHRGPISSLPARSKRGQTGPNGSRNQPSPVVPVKTGTSHPCVGAPCVDVGAVREPPEVTPPPTYSQTNDNCPLHHAPAGCYIVHIRHSRAGGQILSPLRGTKARMRVKPRPQSTRGMRRNERVLKVSPLLPTPDEANQSQRGLMLAQCHE